MTEENGIPNAGEGRQRAARLPQSGHGIASFVLAIVSGLAIAFGISLAAALMMAGNPEEHLAVFGTIGFILIAFLVLALVGVVLGFIALRRQDRRRTFGAIGLGLNAFILIGTGGLMLLGTVLRHSNS
jgi:hypothetical protein